MTHPLLSDHRSFSRREMLAMSAALGAVQAFEVSPAFAAATPVLSRPIPRTGERLPVIGVGTAIVFDIGGDAAKRAERRAVIQTMLEGGAKLIDTAPSYGTAEAVVGDLLADTKTRDKVFLATKVRPAGRDATIAEMQQSLRRLRTDKVDLIQLHNVGTGASDTAAQIALLREWKDQGVFRYVGITHSVANTNERMIETMQREKVDFVQINYSMAERSVEQRLLAGAAQTGTAVLVNLPFGRGKLFSAVRGRQLPAWAAEFDATSWAQFFLKYILAQDAVTAVIPGTDKPEYMLDNLNAGRGRLPDAAMRRKMVEFFDSLG
ncbi:MAG: aldo/keto reductase [Betaproteobacteria bacterium]|nr:aldo/keto reductase [Betaproteobacteria bacterium]